MKKPVQTRIFDVLASRGQSVMWFASQMGIERSRLYRIEWGERPMPDDYLDRAARVLQLPREMLIFLPSELRTLHDSQRERNNCHTQVPA